MNHGLFYSICVTTTLLRDDTPSVVADLPGGGEIAAPELRAFGSADSIVVVCRFRGTAHS